MPLRRDINKVLVIGSGPIIIGQAAEFDYAGTQACKVLKDEGLEVVLINSNPATIMTDKNIADRVYIEPLTVDVVKNIILKERPDSILPTLGGQTGLNFAVELAETGFLEKYGVKLLGTNVLTIKKAEDREMFKSTMEKINQPCVESIISETVEDGLEFAKKVGYPLIIRPAYTMGGTGGGIVNNDEEMKEICADGIRASRVSQVLIEKCISGWKEIEFETMRDSKDNAITICSMENIDPVGIHTGDSIVVAPTQTLGKQEYTMLRQAALDIVRELEIEGGCNVQFALNPDSLEYAIIEVNPRVSRSSALASKATGYPIARVASLIAIGYTLDEIKNQVTGSTFAIDEPKIDYVVCKYPRFPFDKFIKADHRLGTKMKATGEVMSIGQNIESALLKAIRSLELGNYSLEVPQYAKLTEEELIDRIKQQTNDRFFYVAEAIRRNMSLDEIFDITKIDRFFLNKMKNIIVEEEKVKKYKLEYLTEDNLRKLKRMGFSDLALANWCDERELKIRFLRKKMNILPTFKKVDTCAGIKEAVSPYYYSTYEDETEIETKKRPNTIIVLGSGPIRIGQGVEFDYCSVHCIWALKKLGYEAVIINNNPETVSTDFDISDRLYFEPLTSEEMWNILEVEQPKGVVVQFGGQTAIKLAKDVKSAGFDILGTALEDINNAEDREEFDNLLTRLNLARPKGHTVFTKEDAVKAANELTYPVLVRPSYVLGGQGMEIAYNDKDINAYMDIITRVTQEHPILIDKYIMGKELEVDALCDGEDILVPGIMEHIERAGVHSGDSMSVCPAIHIDERLGQMIMDETKKLAIQTKTIGLINIQYILKDDRLYVIEVNPRSSRTIPYISKVTGVPMVQLAVRCSLGEKIKKMGYGIGLYRKIKLFAVKSPVFSNEKIANLEISLSPEMKSTGEVLGIGRRYSEALLKSLIASHVRVKQNGGILITVANNDKDEMLEIARGYQEAGYRIFSTKGTGQFLKENGVESNIVDKIGSGSEDIVSLLKSGEIDIIINTPTRGRDSNRDGFKIRRMAVEQGLSCLTSLDTARVLLKALRLNKTEKELEPISIQDLEV